MPPHRTVLHVLLCLLKEYHVSFTLLQFCGNFLHLHGLCEALHCVIDCTFEYTCWQVLHIAKGINRYTKYQVRIQNYDLDLMDLDGSNEHCVGVFMLLKTCAQTFCSLTEESRKPIDFFA